LLLHSLSRLFDSDSMYVQVNFLQYMSLNCSCCRFCCCVVGVYVNAAAVVYLKDKVYLHIRERQLIHTESHVLSITSLVFVIYFLMSDSTQY